MNYFNMDNIRNELIRVSQELNDLKDLDASLDKILLEARNLTGAEAGSIFLVRDGELHFSYVQNEVLFPENDTNKQVYTNFAVPIDERSIVGHVALSGEALLIEDAYHLPAGVPYAFNTYFDEQSGYRTRSLITVPLKSIQDKVIGVMQLINATDGRGHYVPFAPERREILPLFTLNASSALERARMTREIILRMIRMAELRDPTETGAHVQRVGAFAAEIYHRWAMNRGVAEVERKRYKDLLRIAAMLHDVGKVGISDMILKKPDTLTYEEFRVMRWHTVYGARLFFDSTSDLDSMSLDIALNHHERWDGGGYPGRLEDLFSDDTREREAKRGEEIPLSARIVALADVYDALSSRRVYKESWSQERTLEFIRGQSGRQFDPEVVEAFLSILDVIFAIQGRFTEEKLVEESSIEGRVSG